MSFWDHLPPSAREQLIDLGVDRTVAMGEVVVRRGAVSGEVLLVRSGQLEAVDLSARPVHVLARLAPGDVVGERSFLDGGGASSDVRARAQSVCRVWQWSALTDAFDRDASLAAAVWQAFARDGSARSRSTIAAPARPAAMGHAGPHPDVVAVTSEIEAALEGPLSAVGAAIGPAFDRVHHHLARLPDHGARARVGGAAWLRVRNGMADARLIQMLMERGPVGIPSDAQAHVQAGSPSGASPKGVALDEALLALPTARALRASAALVGDFLAERVRPGQRWSRFSVDGGVGTARIAKVVEAAGGAFHSRCDPSDTLTLLGSQGAMPARADGVVLDGVLRAVPDRLIVGLLRRVVQAVEPGSPVALVTLGPSPDALAWAHLFSWPMLRRSPETVAALMERAGLESVGVWRAGRDGAGLLVGHAAKGGPR